MADSKQFLVATGDGLESFDRDGLVVFVEDPALFDELNFYGLSETNFETYDALQSVSIGGLVAIAEKAAEFCYAAANRGSSGAYELPELETLLVEAGFLTPEQVERDV